MTRFERLLGSGLRSTGDSEGHLDADQICAYVENGTGRAMVMDHAARCPECRDALFLMSGERFSQAPARAWRWAWIPAAAAVCALGVALPVFLHRDTRRPVPVIVRVIPSQPPIEVPTARPVTTVPAKPLLKKAVAPAKAPVKTDDESMPNVVQAEPPTVAPPQPSLAEAEQSKPAARSQTIPTPGPPQQTIVQQVTPTRQDSLRQFDQNAKAQRSSPAVFFDPEERSAKQRRLSAPMLGMLPAVPARGSQWTVAGGVAEQSLDAGATWRQVPIDEKVRFLAVGNIGIDVWAAGSGGALFHSYDNGEHWRRISVIDGTETLNDDIVSLRLASRQEIRLVAASGERWTSQDGGHSWKHE